MICEDLARIVAFQLLFPIIPENPSKGIFCFITGCQVRKEWSKTKVFLNEIYYTIPPNETSQELLFQIPRQLNAQFHQCPFECILSKTFRSFDL